MIGEAAILEDGRSRITPRADHSGQAVVHLQLIRSATHLGPDFHKWIRILSPACNQYLTGRSSSELYFAPAYKLQTVHLVRF